MAIKTKGIQDLHTMQQEALVKLLQQMVQQYWMSTMIGNWWLLIGMRKRVVAGGIQVMKFLIHILAYLALHWNQMDILGKQDHGNKQVDQVWYS